jgi:glutamine synthetase
MPKPFTEHAGSGMHTHMSLFEGDRNAFYDPTDEHRMSKVAKAFVAGLLAHAPEITAVTNQWVNSYKRLIGDSPVAETGELIEAPAFACWGHNIRSALVRVPLYKRGKANTARVEFRLPDSACNPYLTFALMLAAGLRGIQGSYELPPPAGDDISALTDSQRRARGIRPLPGSLSEAIGVMETSSLVRETLGDELFEFFLRNKRAEWGAYRRQVTQFEINRYLPLL